MACVRRVVLAGAVGFVLFLGNQAAHLEERSELLGSSRSGASHLAQGLPQADSRDEIGMDSESSQTQPRASEVDVDVSLDTGGDSSKTSSPPADVEEAPAFDGDIPDAPLLAQFENEASPSGSAGQGTSDTLGEQEAVAMNVTSRVALLETTPRAHRISADVDARGVTTLLAHPHHNAGEFPASVDEVRRRQMPLVRRAGEELLGLKGTALGELKSNSLERSLLSKDEEEEEVVDATTPAPDPVDCVWSAWDSWEPWECVDPTDPLCCQTIRSRRREYDTPAARGGAPCSGAWVKEETKTCALPMQAKSATPSCSQPQLALVLGFLVVSAAVNFAGHVV
jgi:hypothetical protein